VRNTRLRAAAFTAGLPALALAISAFASLASCATPLRVAADIEAERLLPPGAAVLLRLDRALSVLVMGSLGGDEAAASVEAVADRIDEAVLALMPAGAGTDGPLVYAVATGSWPAGAVSLKLSSDRAWKKEGRGFAQEDGPLRLAFATGGRLFLGTGPLDSMEAAAKAPSPQPVPERWLDSWAADVALFAPDPLSGIGSRLGLEPGAVPMRALVLSAVARADAYDAAIMFEFGDEESARVFYPICRLLLLGLARGFWPERAAAILGMASWRISGTVVSVSGLALSAGELAAFLSVAGG